MQHCLDKNVMVNNVHCAGNIDIKKDENSNVSLILTEMYHLESTWCSIVAGGSGYQETL